jgi:hypothetical protein
MTDKQTYALVWAILFSTFFANAGEIFSTNSFWQFRRGTSEASTPAAAWRTPEFAATEFSLAPGPFWYGDPFPSGTELVGMQNSYTCIYLRQPFVVANLNEVLDLRLGAFVDDGFVAWINGIEVLRVNMPAGEPANGTLSTGAPSEPPPFFVYDLGAPAAYLRPGTNILAIQVFNTSRASTDLGFDAALSATFSETTPPRLVRFTPAAGVISNLTGITVEFSEPVTEVHADDLLVNGIPANQVTKVANAYTFTFVSPQPGPVSVTWSPGHGIVDLASPPNPFDGGAAEAVWEYELVDQTAPTVTNLYPPAGATLRNLSQIEVKFSEDVLGLKASDLSINGLPATNVSQIPGGAFTFRFPLQTNGLILFAWTLNHNITDTAIPPNRFAGGSWSYQIEAGPPLGELVISEMVAANTTTNGLVDEDRELEDWIEIHNRGERTVNLENWSLSDDPDVPGLWTFPARQLGPGEYLVVFASGKDRKPVFPGNLHTSFKLADTGEHLGLYPPESPRILSGGWSPFPEQRNGIAYGLDETGNSRYFVVQTPGRANGMSTVLDVCAPVHVNVNRGHFNAPFDLKVSCATPGASVRYTTDGSEPTASSPEFPGTLRVTATMLFRAAAVKPNYLPSLTETHSYLFIRPDGDSRD